MTKKISALFFLIFISGFTVRSQTATLVEALKSDNEVEKVEGLKKLILHKDIITFPILNAINSKRLYLHEKRLVTIEKLEEGELAVFYLYPKYERLVSEDGQQFDPQKTTLKEIKFSRKDRLALLPILPFVNLSSLDEEKRKLAYGQFQQRGTINDITILKQALGLEENQIMKRFGKETILAIKLNHSKNSTEQVSLAQELTDNLGDNTQYILTEYLKTIDKSSPAFVPVHRMVNDLMARSDKLGFFQNIFSGVSLGSILIMIALGLSIIYGLAGVINMAHGEFIMIGAYTTYCMQQLLGSVEFISDNLTYFISLPVAFVVAGVFGLIIERLVLRRLYNRPLESLLATWGISLVFIQLARTIFGDLTSVKTPSLLSGGLEIAPQLMLPYNRIYIIGMTVILISFTYLFLYKSRNGLRIRSVTQNRDMSACLGISTKKIDALTFFIGSGMAGLAGCCITLIGNVVPDMGQTYVVDSFLVVVTGGVGNLFGSVFAGLGMGVLTKAIEPIFHAVYGKVIILILIIIFLQFKPKGLFPGKVRATED